MPAIPQPKFGSPQEMEWARWVHGEVQAIRSELDRANRANGNTDSSQSSTMAMLVDRLGNVQAGIQDIVDSSIAAATFDASAIVSGTLNTARVPNLDASKITSGTITNPVSTSGDVTAAGHGTFNAAWTYNVSGVTRLAVWMDSSGRLGQTSSSERFKDDIKKWSPEEQAVLAIQLVKFHWKPEYGDTDHWEHGVIAEQLHELGLNWLVAYDHEGLPFSVHYDRIALAVLSVVQKHHDRIEAIETRLAAFEENN